MKFSKTLFSASVFLFLLGWSLSAVAADFTHYVNPFVGTGKTGNTFPGALVPWGMVSVSPHNDLKAPSGYKYGAPYIYGFGQTHLSGADCPELGNVMLMATTGSMEPLLEKRRSEYDSESASPGFYQVNLKTFGITAEMTATTRVGVARFVFPVRKGDANILIDLGHRLTDDPATVTSFESHIKIDTSQEVEGYSQSGDFCSSYAGNKETIYFVAQFSKPATVMGTWKENKLDAGMEQTGGNIGAFFSFSTATVEPIMVKVGISYVSVENARLNLTTEVKEWDFDRVRSDAKKSWQEELARINVTDTNEEKLKTFYTALYHMMMEPSVFSDVNGEYQGMGRSGVKTATDYTRYSVFSMWNTYRNLHPFLALFYPERELDMVKSLTEMAKEGGWMPRFEVAGNDTQVMVADPAVPVIVDTYLQGIQNFDADTAYQTLVKSLTPKDNSVYGGLKSLLRYGYIPKNDHSGDRLWGTVSMSLEYAYDYWCLAQMAQEMKKDDDYKKYIHLSGVYRNLYDPATEFLRPKNQDGSWLTPFDPLATNGDESWNGSGGPGYVEGGAWQYLFDVPQDMDGLRMLLGGDSVFVNRLQECFDNGHYDATNEPDINWSYLFDEVPHESWRTQKQVRAIMNQDYGNGPDGLPGNDDGGTLSAWYVWSALGFYPVCPGSNRYEIGSPLFKLVQIEINKSFYPGGMLTLKTINNSDRNGYIRSILMNGEDFKSDHFEHDALVNGKTIVFNMDSEPPHKLAEAVLAPKP
jgi:predicted alpha-1,2-mannosidase